MKITNVNYSNDSSGASIAVRRINELLQKNNIESEIITFIKNDKNLSLNIKLRSFFNRFLKKIIKIFFNINNEYSVNFNLIPSGLFNDINDSNSNIINLHWIGNEMLSIKQISKIKKTVVWTLHDMWPYTAIENYTDINKFNTNYAHNNNNLPFFLKYIYDLKIKNFENVKFVICTSEWQKRMVEKSLVFKKAKKIIIPLPLDFKLWSPKEKKKSKIKLNLSLDKKVILFISSHKYTSKRKGLNFVLNYLENSKRKDLIFLSVNCPNVKILNKNIKHINFDNIISLDERIDIYSSADLFLMPSKIESFGQTALEAHACGCPIVTFKNTGPQDIVDHFKTGYISNYLDYYDFKKGIEWSLSNDFNKNYIRSYVENKFSEEVIIKKYKNLFKDLT